MEKFEPSIERIFNKFNSVHSDLVKQSNDIFCKDISKLKKYLSIHCEITSEEIEIPDDYIPDSDDLLLVKLVICELYKHLSLKSYSDYQNLLRKSILKKKNNLKIKVSNGDFSNAAYYNEYSKDVCLSWLGDKSKLILPDFAFFGELSLTIQIPHTLTTLEYLLIDIINEKDTYDLPETGLLSVFNRNVVPSCSFNSKGLLDFYVDFQVEEGVYKRVFWARDLPPKAKIESEEIGKNELVQYSEDYSDYFKLIIPDSETQLISMHIYNMLNYDWCNKGYIEYSIDDIILKMNPELDKISLSSAERQEKRRLKK